MRGKFVDSANMSQHEKLFGDRGSEGHYWGLLFAGFPAYSAGR
jgi:hypothetical protein